MTVSADDCCLSLPAAQQDVEQTTHTARGARLLFGMSALRSGEVETIRYTDGVSAVAGALQTWDFGGTSYVTILGVDIDHSIQGEESIVRTSASNIVGPEAVLRTGLLSWRTFQPGDRGVAITDLHYASFF